MENSAKKTKQQNTIELRQKRQQEFLIEKFKEIHIVSVACKKAGVSKATYYRWRDDSDFADKASEALREGKETTNDFAESQLMKKISEGNMHAIKYYLQHNKQEYMYRPDLFADKEKHDEIDRIRRSLKNLISDSMENRRLEEEVEKLRKENEKLKSAQNKGKNEAIKG
jgi:hypothetical protein